MARNNNMEEKSFSEIQRIEQKYLVPIEYYDAIKSEVEKYLKPAYKDKDVTFVKIETTYLDSSDLEFFRFHSYGMSERLKVRVRIYGANGKMDRQDRFLEIKEKMEEEVKKYRVQLDDKNFTKVKNGGLLEFNSELEELNSPLFTHTDLKRYIERYNKIANKYEMTPLLTNQYVRNAYGENDLRITLDKNINYKSNRTIALSQAYKIKKASDWKVAKEYGKKYDPKENFILEVKHNSEKNPEWLQNLLDQYSLKEEKFSKYMYCTYWLLKEILGD